MKVIYELIVYSLFSLLMLSACSDADDVVADGALAGDNISPVSSFRWRLPMPIMNCW